MKVKFYKVNHDINPKVIGRRYPQITHSVGGYWNVLDQESAYGQLGVWNTPTSAPPIGKLNLTKGAKYTDVLSASMFSHHGFIMSAKSKAVFEKYRIGNHWFFPVEIVHKEKILDYFILHTNNDYIDQIDWEKSEFALSNWIPEKCKEENTGNHKIGW